VVLVDSVFCLLIFSIPKTVGFSVMSFPELLMPDETMTTPWLLGVNGLLWYAGS